jgi:mannitol/fructose-specific phosphotransferase system IIA component (Ntr-type)
MLLTDILSPKWIKVPLAATSKEGAIGELVELLAGDGMLDRPEEALQAVLEREGIRSTGIGNGLALPHAKCGGARQLMMAIGRPAAPLEFGSVDGRAVDLIVLLVGPKHMTGEHIQALARVSRFLSLEDLRKRLRSAQTPQEIYQLVEEMEKASQSPPTDR